VPVLVNEQPLTPKDAAFTLNVNVGAIVASENNNAIVNILSLLIKLSISFL
jgi:hypothetical protein